MRWCRAGRESCHRRRLVISKSSLVMLAWRSLLYSSVRSLMSCFALSVAFFMPPCGRCVRRRLGFEQASDNSGIVDVLRQERCRTRVRRSARTYTVPSDRPGLPSLRARCPCLHKTSFHAKVTGLIGSNVSIVGTRVHGVHEIAEGDLHAAVSATCEPFLHKAADGATAPRTAPGP